MSELVSISAGDLSAAIDPHGAQLTSLALGGREYLWQGDPIWWNRHAPVLFPIVGTLRDGCATSAAGEIALGRHGLARDYDHAVVQHSASSVTFELNDTPETRAVYPYAFRLNLTYEVSDSARFTQTFRVENTGEGPLPFSVGGHPAFNVPVPGAPGEAGMDENFDDYELVFAHDWSYEMPELGDDGLFSYAHTVPVLTDSSVLPLTHELFTCDTIMFEDVPESTVTLRSRVSGHGVRVDFEGFPYLGVWSAANNAPFVAIEPWTGHSTLDSEDDVFEHKRNITILEPGAVDTRSFTVTLL